MDIKLQEFGIKIMELLELIKSRRSIRKFKQQPISEEFIQQILEAARWAPSGLNNQPWRFIIIKDKKSIEELSQFTKYSYIIKQAAILIVVFLDNTASYDRTKDIQAIGACIQNMLLMCHALGLGCCWIGEILNRKDEVEKFLGISSSLELMAVLAIGWPQETPTIGKRKPLDELILKKI